MIRRGKKEDLKSIMKMVEATIVMMREEQNDQWDELYPTLNDFEQDLQNQSLYILEENGGIMGSITITQNLPIEYNQSSILWRKIEQAYTTYRLVVDPAARGRGVATKLILFAEEIAKQNGTPYLKIDTYALNKQAQKLFQKNGFHKAGEMAYGGKKWPFYCYDKIL